MNQFNGMISTECFLCILQAGSGLSDENWPALHEVTEVNTAAISCIWLHLTYFGKMQ